MSCREECLIVECDQFWSWTSGNGTEEVSGVGFVVEVKIFAEIVGIWRRKGRSCGC